MEAFVRVVRLSVRDFRGYHEASAGLGDGLTVITGGNGQGKTNLLEAVGYLASLRSFRGAPPRGPDPQCGPRARSFEPKPTANNGPC